MYRISTLLISCLLLAIQAFSQRAVCPDDTLLYAYSKTTVVDTMILDPSNTYSGFQYFECPQEITLNGARFYGWKFDTAGGLTMNVAIQIYKATNDSIPSPTLLASDSVTLVIPDSFDGPHSSYAVNGTWTPISVDEPYVVVVTANPGAPEFVMLHNHLDGIDSDGNKEWLSGVRQGSGAWIKSYDYNYNSAPFDADFLIEPFVQYDITAHFINDPECLKDELGETVEFFNDGAPIVDSRMYNRYAFNYLPNRQQWSYGDGSSENAANPIHFYPTNGPYVATMKLKIITWGSEFCNSTATQIIKEKPSQEFTYKTKNLEVDFTNETFGQFSSISYDFGDGNHSSSENPKHKYFEPGTYWVCQTMQTSCGEIKQCKNVAVATNTALNCGKDSVRYTAARATDHLKRDLRTSNPGRLFGIGQTFDATQPMVVHGFSFYATHNGFFKDDYPVICKIYDKGGNKLPDGEALAYSTVHINKVIVDTFYNDSTRYTAIFNKPVDILNDYILTIELDTNFGYENYIPLQIGVSDWLEHDGEGDLLAIGKYNDTAWVTAASVATFNCEGAACDMDVIIEPLIEYNVDANFDYDFFCMDINNQPAAFYETSSTIVKSKFYNQVAFYSSFVQAYEWVWGDGTPNSEGPSPSHTFVGDGPFDVTLSVKMEGWTSNCFNSQTHDVPVDPIGGFTYEQVTSQVDFTDTSKYAQEFLWTFTDNTISTLKNPVHYFTEIGTFEVCQYVSNVCGSDTTCDSITVNIVGIPEEMAKDFHIYPNPATDNIYIDADFSIMSNLEIELFDMSGRSLRSTSLNEQLSNTSVYVGDLARGTYMLRIRADEFEGTRMVVVGN